MLKLKNLLLPVDYSRRCLAAAAAIPVLARGASLRVTVLHATGEGPFPVSDDYRGAGVDGALPRSTFVEALEPMLAGLDVAFTELPGEPARVIGDYALENASDLIVMPTRGLGALRRFLLGSVTAKVLHDVGCPVWTGTHLDGDTTPMNGAGINRIACAVDLGPQSASVLRWAADFAAAFDARLTLVHASKQLEPSIGVVHDIEWRAHVYRATQERIAALLDETGVEAEIKLVPGDPASAVASAAADLETDVLVIGRTPDTALGRLRTNAYAIIRQSPCPVVSV